MRSEDLFSEGLRLYREGRLFEAKQACQKVLQLDSKSADTWSNLEWLLDELGMYEEAEVACRTALKIDPQ